MTGTLSFSEYSYYNNSYIGSRCTKDDCCSVERLHVCEEDVSSRDKTVTNRYTNRVSVHYLRVALSDAHPPQRAYK